TIRPHPRIAQISRSLGPFPDPIRLTIDREIARPWKVIIVVIGIEHDAETDLTHVVPAKSSAALFFGFVQSGEEQSGQDRDNSHDNQQLDQGEARRAFRSARAQASS